MRVGLLSISLLLASACLSRPPGPHQDERGLVTFWMINGASETRSNCSDAYPWSGIRAQRVRADPYDGIVWYLIYGVSEDGLTAVDYDCENMHLTTCAPGDVVTFKVDGHTLTAELDSETMPLSTPECAARLTSTLVVEDGGLEGRMTETIAVKLTGDPEACAAEDARIRADSSNGEGIANCVVTADYRMAFSHVRSADPR